MLMLCGASNKLYTRYDVHFHKKQLYGMKFKSGNFINRRECNQFIHCIYHSIVHVLKLLPTAIKVNVGNDQIMSQSERNSHCKSRDGKTLN